MIFGQTDSIKIMSFNIWVNGAGVNDGVQKVVDEIQLVNPNVVLLQEAYGIALSIAEYLDWYVYNSSSSTAIISQYPITEVFLDQTFNSFIGARIQISSNPIKDIIVCEENRHDVEKIGPEYLKGLTFHYVSNMHQVLDIAITNKNVKNYKNLNVK